MAVMVLDVFIVRLKCLIMVLDLPQNASEVE